MDLAAQCLTAWHRGEQSEAAEDGGLLVAEFVLLVSGFLRSDS